MIESHIIAEKDWRQLTVAVTGINAKPDNPGPGLAVARCIREDEAFVGQIIGLGYDTFDPGLYHTQYCDEAFLLPYPSAGEQALLDRLSQVVAHHPIDVLIPCLDAELISFARLEPKLKELGISLFMPTQQQIQSRNKDRLSGLCNDIGVLTPESQNITSPNYFYQPQPFGYPMVVKGVFYDAVVAYGADAAASAFHKIVQQWGYPVLVQRFIEGEEFNLTGVGDGRGGLIAPVMMRKQALTDKGKAWAGIAIDEPKLLQAAQKLVDKLQWKGPLEVEMLRDKQGNFHLVEINPRFPAWIYLSVGVGNNLPVLLLKALCEQPIEVVAPKIGTLFIRYAQEMVVTLEQYKNITMLGQRQSLHDHTPGDPLANSVTV